MSTFAEIRVRSSLVGIGIVLYLCSSVMFAQGPLAARTKELPEEDTYPYIPVNLNRVANDTQPAQFPSQQVLVNANIPFDLPKKDAANCLNLKSMGWSAAKSEDAEYPGYIANYDNWTAAVKDPMRCLTRVPVGDYKAIWLLAAADDDPSLSDKVTLRLGCMEGQGPVAMHNLTVQIPRTKATNAATVPGVSATIPTAAGNVYLVRVPFAKAIAQDYQMFRHLWLEFTKEMRVAVNLPDPYRYQTRPLGIPSGVRIYGVTLERSPLQVEMTGAEHGNVFNEPQTPTFKLKLVNVLSDHYVPYDIETIAVADDGTEVKQTLKEAFRTGSWVYSGPIIHRTIAVPVPKRGQYRLKVNILSRGTDLVSTRETTFAVLPPDTRKYRDESPFGTWDFGGTHATASDPEMRGTLFVKAGFRYGLSSEPEAVRQKYGLLSNADESGAFTVADVAAVKARYDANPGAPPPPRFLVFHETGISGPHLTRTPDVFTGRKYKMNEAEEKLFKELLKKASDAAPAIRAVYPQAEIYFGNTTPHLLEEFLRAGFPAKDIGTIGNESGSFMRLPETQPLDYVSQNACLFMLRQIADHYGAKDLPLRQCLEITYPGSGPGNLTEQTQAAYLVRHNIHSLAWQIPVIRPMCLTDMGNSYYHSNWGATGLCTAWPNVGPKPAYVAFAVQTQMLDGAKFTRFIPVDSTSAYAAEFRKKDGTFVTCLWTVRGSRPLTLKVPGASGNLVHTNLMGREAQATVANEQATVEITPQPSYVVTPKAIATIELGAPVHEIQPPEKSVVLSPLDKLDDWMIKQGRDVELETYNFVNPRRQGNFEYQAVANAGKSALEVKPKLPVDGPVYLQMYSSLELKQPKEIPGEPTQIGLLVDGNGGWGRVIFELEDASGQRWISIGAEQAGTPNPWMADWLTKEEFTKLNPKSMNVSDWNSDDAWGRSVINFDGWRLVKFPMPGQYPGEGYHWPMNSQWRSTGDGVVHYPLKFKRLVVTMPEKVLYGTQYAPPKRYDVRLKDLVVMYDPVEKVFNGE